MDRSLESYRIPGPWGKKKNTEEKYKDYPNGI